MPSTRTLSASAPQVADEAAGKRSPARRTKVAHQTYLVGRTVYLRGLELADAATARFWADSPFPRSTDVIEDQLKEDVPNDSSSGTRRLVICRRSDDSPVGSLEMYSEDGHTTDITPFVSGLFAEALRMSIMAEVIRLVVPWLLHEHDQMTVRLHVNGGHVETEQAAQSCGMQKAFVLREAKLTANGKRVDEVCWQALHPTWLQSLGAPEPSVFGNVQRDVRSPAPQEYPRRSKEPPAQALLVGKRIFLRAIEQDDADEIARWSMRETQTAYDVGRMPRTPISYWHWHRKNYEADPPDWVRFAICLVKDGAVIGSNGLAHIDWVHRTAETETEIVQPAYRGSGYGTEAKHLLLEYGFERLGLHMVRSFAWAFNTPSCSALRKQGYRDAGRLNWTGIKDGAFADDLVFDLLASEWRAARNR